MGILGIVIGAVASWPHAAAGSQPWGPSSQGPSLPFEYGPYLKGNAKLTFPTGEPGKVSIVEVSPMYYDGLGSAFLAVAYRNNTGHPVSEVEITATARGWDGASNVTGRHASPAVPGWLQPGEVGFGAATLGMLGLATLGRIEAHESVFHRSDPAAYPALMAR